ncbi:ester cyclase [Clostridium grantii]|uniref:Predicted ester cyclase n=1 Tax=Clostridium grantii DSM 8605 TaxID=1121316 RepID=A0A1M5VUY1_9CLOT|nr:ester cyclase [Clostridium grantii]SHH79008.1 Predicted ester cyclase [Clostridium grantii DSM 8605]
MNETNKVFYGDNSLVNSAIWRDYNDYANLPSKNKQELIGFDPKYKDFVDYILKITHEIWEEKGIGVIYDTYSNDVQLHLSSQTLAGIQGVIKGTLETLHAFPDRKLIGQNVVWAEHYGGALLSSHRIFSTATNLGDSSFGPATGKNISYRTVVDCAVYENRIFEEWLVRDNLWIVEQLGINVHELAKKMALATKNNPLSLQKDFGIPESMEGQFFPDIYKAKDSGVGEMIIEMISNVWGRKYINEVKKYYHENAVTHFICNKELNGHDDIQGMLISLFAAFPNAAVVVDRVSCNEREEKNTWDVAARWRIKGIHEGIGFFGKPSGQKVEFMGINHYTITEDKIKEEWMTFDALDVLRQIYMGIED